MYSIVEQVGENEDIPENIKDIIVKKPIDVSGPSDQESNMSDEFCSVIGDESLRLQKVSTQLVLPALHVIITTVVGVG